MKPLSRQQRLAIEAYLNEQKLTFLPLRNEILDHLMSDLESHIDRGCSFEEAWPMILGKIPAGHFNHLQTETMETIDKKFNASRGFTILALVLLLAASMFKLLHLQYSVILLFASAGVMVAALVTGAISGARLHKQKKGRLMLTAVVLGVVLFLVSWCMQVLQLPGSGLLRMVSAPFLIFLFPALTIYFRTNRGNNDHVLTYLHERHTPGISRFMIILLAIGFVLKLVSVFWGYEVGIPNVVLALVTGGAGLQFFALQWQYKPENTTSIRSYVTQAALIVGFVAFMIPTLAYSASGISIPTKVAAATIFYLMAGGVVVSELPSKPFLLIIVALSWGYILAWAAISLGLVDTTTSSILFSAPILAILVGGLVASRRHRMLMTYMIIVVAHFMYFYPFNTGA